MSLMCGSLALLLAACGSSDEGKVVMKAEDGNTRTYKEVRDLIADGSIDLQGADCATFASFGAKERQIRFPAGQALFVQACEEGQRKAQKS